MMIDDDSLKQLLRIDDGLMELCKWLNEKHDIEISSRLIPLVDVFDFTLGPHPISSKGTTELGGAKRRSAFGLCLH